MAQRATELQEPDLLGRYLRALVREQDAPRAAATPGHDTRTCSRCGREALFTLDPEGIWYTCRRCGHLA